MEDPTMCMHRRACMHCSIGNTLKQKQNVGTCGTVREHCGSPEKWTQHCGWPKNEHIIVGRWKFHNKSFTTERETYPGSWKPRDSLDL